MTAEEIMCVHDGTNATTIIHSGILHYNISLIFKSIEAISFQSIIFNILEKLRVVELHEFWHN